LGLSQILLALEAATRAIDALESTVMWTGSNEEKRMEFVRARLELQKRVEEIGNVVRNPQGTDPSQPDGDPTGGSTSAAARRSGRPRKGTQSD